MPDTAEYLKFHTRPEEIKEGKKTVRKDILRALPILRYAERIATGGSQMTVGLKVAVGPDLPAFGVESVSTTC